MGDVVPLARRQRPSHEQCSPPVADMADAARSFGRLERCAVTLQSSPFGADEIEWPIVAFQVQLPAVQKGLDQLQRISVGTCPDTSWVVRLGDARASAAARLRSVTQSLYRSPPGTGPLDGRLAADIKELAEALHGLRQVIAQRCPDALRAP